jgi:hypothetical protein
MKDLPSKAKRNTKVNKDKSKMQVKNNWRRKAKRKAKVIKKENHKQVIQENLLR